MGSFACVEGDGDNEGRTDTMIVEGLRGSLRKQEIHQKASGVEDEAEGEEDKLYSPWWGILSTFQFGKEEAPNYGYNCSTTKCSGIYTQD